VAAPGLRVPARRRPLTRAGEARYHRPPGVRHAWGVGEAGGVTGKQRWVRLGLLGLGVAGGLLPDPGALAILLASVASGRLILGLFTVVVFSVGFASVLVLVGVVAARVGQIVLAWLSSRWVGWLQVGAALLIVLVGLLLTANAWRTVASLR